MSEQPIYKESEPFENSKCAHCQKEIGPHEALCLDCEKMMLSYEDELQCWQ